MPRLSFFLFISTICINVYSQNIPANRLLLKMIYGNCDKNGESYTRAKTEQSSTDDSITYKIKFKKFVIVENQKLLFVICEAPNSYLHGHTLGFRDFYYFKEIGNEWAMTNSITNAEVPLGDISEYDIVDIGKNKKALIATFQSTGNQHFEKTNSLYYLTLQKISFLLKIDMEYSNEAWNIPQTENEACEATRYQSTYNIIKNNKNWFDIKVFKQNYGFTKGCKSNFVKSEENILYKHNDKEYVEIKK